MGLLWGAIVAFLVEGRLLHAAAFSAAAFVLSLLGLIHAPTIGLAPTPITWSYLIVTGLLVALGLPAALSERAAARRGVVAQATLAAPQSSPD